MEKFAFSIPSFCEGHDIGRSKAYEEISSGRLKTMKVGRRRLITSEAAAEWRRLMEEKTTREMTVAE